MVRRACCWWLNWAANPAGVRAPATTTKPQVFSSQVFKTLGSNNQKWYRAEGGKLRLRFDSVGKALDGYPGEVRLVAHDDLVRVGRAHHVVGGDDHRHRALGHGQRSGSGGNEYEHFWRFRDTSGGYRLGRSSRDV